MRKPENRHSYASSTGFSRFSESWDEEMGVFPHVMDADAVTPTRSTESTMAAASSADGESPPSPSPSHSDIRKERRRSTVSCLLRFFLHSFVGSYTGIYVQTNAVYLNHHHIYTCLCLPNRLDYLPPLPFTTLKLNMISSLTPQSSNSSQTCKPTSRSQNGSAGSPSATTASATVRCTAHPRTPPGTSDFLFGIC